MLQNECIHVECSDPKWMGGWDFCKFHNEGGVLGNGETFDQYQIIEQDFIDFIKIIPIDDDEHLSVNSPVLRDIIIRSCVQIEIFFKEWAKFECSEDKNNSLSKEYFKIFKKENTHRGERNWKFGSYYFFSERLKQSSCVYVRPRDEKLEPFFGWKSKEEAPEWWKAYNSIKHSGVSAKKFATLKNALNSLSALFALHCSNIHSRRFLSQYKNYSITSSINEVNIKFHSITSPFDTKRYLFKSCNSFQEKEIELVTKLELEQKKSILWDK